MSGTAIPVTSFDVPPPTSTETPPTSTETNGNAPAAGDEFASILGRLATGEGTDGSEETSTATTPAETSKSLETAPSDGEAEDSEALEVVLIAPPLAGRAPDGRPATGSEPPGSAPPRNHADCPAQPPTVVPAQASQADLPRTSEPESATAPLEVETEPRATWPGRSEHRSTQGAAHAVARASETALDAGGQVVASEPAGLSETSGKLPGVQAGPTAPTPRAESAVAVAAGWPTEAAPTPTLTTRSTTEGPPVPRTIAVAPRASDAGSVHGLLEGSSAESPGLTGPETRPGGRLGDQTLSAALSQPGPDPAVLLSRETPTTPLHHPSEPRGRMTASEVVDWLRGLVRVARGDGFASARISLAPPELGQLEIKLTVRDGRVVADIAAETAEAANVLVASSADLRRSLEASGLVVQDLNVTQAGPEGRSTAEGRGDGEGSGHAPARGVRSGAPNNSEGDVPVASGHLPLSTSTVDVLA